VTSTRHRRRRSPRRDQGDSCHRTSGRYRDGQAHQDPERHPHKMVGTADVSRRDGAASKGLRQAPGRSLSRHYIRTSLAAPGGFGRGGELDGRAR
jgi:hypothetical protein